MNFSDRLQLPDTPIDLSLRRLVAVRWWVLGTAGTLSLLVPWLLAIRLPLWPLLSIVGIAAIWNVICWRRLVSHTTPEPDGPAAIFSQLCLDLTAIAALLFFSGGATNPLISMLLLPVVAAALSLPIRQVIGIAILAVLAYSLLMFFFVPLALADPSRAAALHLTGMWATFVAAVVIIGGFILRMTIALRERDAALAAAREQALRDERVLALGTLAASAAHELGTPLATMAVLADELEFDAHLGAEANADLQLLREQIAYCKRVITGLTQRAGAGRADNAEKLPADEWVNRIFENWLRRNDEPQAEFAKVGADGMESLFGTAPALVPDRALEHGLLNLLDNAIRAGAPIKLTLNWDAVMLKISVRDSGPGFSDEALRRAGNEPFPAHATGSGVGLLLTRAAVERQGGRLHLANSAAGGAVAELTLPLATTQQQRHD
jgi:two-component system sensor histidine kinase RegB